MIEGLNNHLFFKRYWEISSFDLKHYHSGDQMVDVFGDYRFVGFETCYVVLTSICEKTPGCFMLPIRSQSLNISVSEFRNTFRCWMTIFQKHITRI